jgi:hypothetical protein
MSMTEEGLTTTTTTRPLEPMKIFPEQTWIPHSWRSLVRLRWNSWQLCLGICFHLEKSQRKHRRMKQREEYRDVLIGETESSHVIWLTSQTSSQRECPHVVPLKDGPIYEYSKHHSHDAERDPHQTKASFKQKEWQHRTRIRRSLVLAHDSLDTFNNSRAFTK